MKTTNNNFRSRTFKRAHEMTKETSKSFAVCLSKAGGFTGCLKN